MSQEDNEIIPVDDPAAHPMQRGQVRTAVAKSIQSSFNRLSFEIEDWAAEVRAVSQAAAVSGDYQNSLKGYEMLGKSMGAIVENASQHVHLHNPIAQVQEASTDEILQRRQVLLDKKAADERKAEEEARAMEDIEDLM